MNYTATKSLPFSLLLRHTTVDHTATANIYATKLHLHRHCGPPTYSLVQTGHANMLTSGFAPHGHILNRLIDLYCKASNFRYAKKLFDEIPIPDVVARTTLIAAYSASGDPKLAREVFDGMRLEMRDIVCYNSIITCYSHNNDGHAAVEVFNDMRRNSFKPDNFIYMSFLAALGLIADHKQHCQQLHCVVVKSGTGFVTSVMNSLIK
ncbi:hypothetical protein OROMI_014552 [Orobanche minor]